MQHSEENMAWAESQIITLAEAYGKEFKSPNTVSMLATGLLDIVGSNEPATHTKLGTVNRGDWLIGLALAGFEFFPKLIALRKMWEQYFPTADGKSSGDLMAGMD